MLVLSALLPGIAGFTMIARANDSDQPPRSPETFTNPILTERDAADPWVVHHDGAYYFTATLGNGIWVWKSDQLSNLDGAKHVKVYDPPDRGPTSRQVWAPEFYLIDGHWYLYFSASDGKDENHRHFVMKSQGTDPLGPYEFKGRVDDYDNYAIDGSLLELPDGRRYWMYTTGRLEIAPMPTPLRAETSQRSVLTEPTETWERTWVEAPQALIRDGRVFVIYSAGHSGTPHYVLGLLELVGDDPLNPDHWKKHPGPVFAPHVSAEGSVFTVGHNCFTKSPDGTEDWIVYHGKDWRGTEHEGFSGRTIRAQPFTWTPDGMPHFGKPIPTGIPIPMPSGEK